MEYVESLSQFQIAGIILLLVVTPLLVLNLRLFWWARQSMQWPKVNGVVVKGIIFRMHRSLDFLFTYELNGITYKGNKPFFYNSNKTLNVKKVADLMDKYPEGQRIVVYYNPLNHKIATLEPGRKDGVNGALLLLLFLFSLGLMAISSPGLISEIMDYFLKTIL
jgi:hypothetical protein